MQTDMYKSDDRDHERARLAHAEAVDRAVQMARRAWADELEEREFRADLSALGLAENKRKRWDGLVSTAIDVAFGGMFLALALVLGKR